LEIKKELTACDQHLPRAAVMYTSEACPLCEALEALVLVSVPREGSGERLVREAFGVAREAMLGGCWDGDG
jgi:hypothetical protein